jgi:hypothetical protein
MVGAEGAVQHHAPAKFLIKVPQEFGHRWHRSVRRKEVPEALEFAHYEE